MIGTEYTLTNQAGDAVKINDHVTDVNNVIALQDYPSFDLSIRNAELPKDGQHGIWDFHSYYGKRLIVFSGVIVGETEAKVHEMRDELMNITKLPTQPTSTNDGKVTITFTDPRSRALQIEAKLQSPIRFRRILKRTYMLEFQMILKSTDLNFESQALSESSGIRGYEMGSIRLPFTLPTQMDWVAEQSVDVVNAGNTEANLTVRLYGEATGMTNPTIKNLTTGVYMTIETTLTHSSHYVEINSKTGAVVDQSGNDLSGLITDDSNFVTLVVGTNQLLFLSDENNGATNPIATRIAPTGGVIETEHRDAIS